MLKLSSVTVRFGGLVAVSGIDLTVNAGEICAVIGPNGAGKSTLFNSISGHTRMTSGDVRLNGHSVAGLPIRKIAAAGIRRTFQNGGLFSGLTVLENVLVGCHQTHHSGMVGAMLRLPYALSRERLAVRQAREALEGLGVGDLASRPVNELSAGQQRLVEIARALAVPGRLLMLDEPAVGLTVLEIERLDGVLRSVAARGVAVLLVEHVLDLVMAVSDRVLVMNNGKRLAEGNPADVRTDSNVVEAYLGTG